MDKLCVKCKEEGNIILRKKDVYCQNCFVTNVNHKFRSLLGKNKVLKSNEKVLLGISGGLGSSIMLDLIKHALNLDTHKKLLVDVVCVHIMGCDGAVDVQVKTTKKVIEMCESYGFKIITADISTVQDDVMLECPNYTVSCIGSSVNKSKLQEIMSDMTPSARCDYVYKLRRNVMLKFAEKLNCNFIFTAETAVTLATNMLSGIVVGRGSQLEHDVGFCDTRDKIKILRPMKDITFEEMKHYASLKFIDITHNEDIVNKSSLHSAIESFVVDLQENFEATVSTVCKTADKIGGKLENDLKATRLCQICQSPMQVEESKLTSLQAINFSRAVSSNPQYLNSGDNIIENDVILKTKMFPFVEALCYGCNRTLSEMKDNRGIDPFRNRHAINS